MHDSYVDFLVLSAVRVYTKQHPSSSEHSSSSLYSEWLHSEEPRLLRKETGQEVIRLLGRGWGLGTPEACSRPCMVRGQAGQGLLAPGVDAAFVRE